MPRVNNGDLRRIARDHASSNAGMGVARYTFYALCEEPLAAAEYLRITGEFHTIILDRIPVITFDTPNIARRSIILIDTLDDLNVNLIPSAAVESAALNRVQEGFEANEFERTAFRLVEMRSQ